MIRQEQSLKNDYNEHLASKWSFGHAMQLRAMQKSIACPTHNQCEIQEVFASRIQDPTRAQVVVLKIMQHNLKVLATKQGYKNKVLKIN